jgi:hypothetical protein
MGAVGAGGQAASSNLGDPYPLSFSILTVPVAPFAPDVLE